MVTSPTLFDRLWASHKVTTNSQGLDLIHIDRNLLTDLTGTIGLEEMADEGRSIQNIGLHIAIPDHAIATGEAQSPRYAALQKRFVERLETLSKTAGVRHFPRGSGRQGIVHVVGLEQGLTLPGLTVVCGDSHTSTHGALGALAWGIGSTEVKHVLATQTLWMKKPLQARIWLEGNLQSGVYSKDVALWLIGKLGADYGREHAVEFAGPVIDKMSIEARASLCNLAVEMGARFGIIAPDQKTLDYVKGRPFAPKGTVWANAVADWSKLASDTGAVFNKQERCNVTNIRPQITWGTSPEQVIHLDANIPDDVSATQNVLDYIGLEKGQRLQGIPVDYVFIGSCANGRIEDLRIAAAVVRDRKIAPAVTAWVTPGSEQVKLEAEHEGLDQVFKAAGFDWREPGCSMCIGVNGDLVPPGKRCVSTSNRNSIGRQGPEVRTHLASPETAAASAIAGFMTTADQLPHQKALNR